MMQPRNRSLAAIIRSVANLVDKKPIKFVWNLLPCLLVLYLLRQLDLQDLGRSFINVDIRYILVSILLFLASQVGLWFRWKKLLQILVGPSFINTQRSYFFDSLSFGAVLPGGGVFGDIWRAKGLLDYKLLDRKKIFLILSVDRLGTIFVAALLASTFLISWLFAPYSFWLGNFIGLFGVVTIACAIFFIRRVLVFRSVIAWFQLMRSTFRHSVSIFLLFSISFYFCLVAFGAQCDFIDFIQINAVVFIISVLPVAIAGFGPREFGAFYFLASIGVSGEIAVASSIIVGVYHLLQALFIFLMRIFFKKRMGDEKTIVSE